MSVYKRYLVSYRHDGGDWNIEIPATSFDDARQRLSQLTFGKIDGELVATVPGALGPLAALTVAVRNILRR